MKVTQAGKALREHKVLATSDGALIEQVVESGGGIDAIAVGDGGYQVRSYPSARRLVRAGGLGVLESLGLEREAPRVGEQAAALPRGALPIDRDQVVVDAEQMELQVHESVGHLDRARPAQRQRGAHAGTRPWKPQTSARCATAPRR